MKNPWAWGTANASCARGPDNHMCQKTALCKKKPVISACLIMGYARKSTTSSSCSPFKGKLPMFKPTNLIKPSRNQQMVFIIITPWEILKSPIFPSPKKHPGHWPGSFTRIKPRWSPWPSPRCSRTFMTASSMPGTWCRTHAMVFIWFFNFK